ncbi:MAG: baseplate J/gp47 family protein [Clostridia bacterium]|nr:baseplate J/gp47 family protein [Clostridia bacterium]
MSKSYEEILNSMNEEFRNLAGYSADDASDIGIRIRLLAGEIYNCLINTEWLKKQMFVQTATDIQLDYHAQERGIERKKAVKAQGELTFYIQTPVSYDINIPIGTVCSTASVQDSRYETVEEGILYAGDLEVTLKARSLDEGKKGNCKAGSISVIITSLPGISEVMNIQAFTGGTEEESDENLRKRIIESYRNISNGTNTAFYKEQALKNENVTSAGVIGLQRGVGTVDVYIWAGGEPSQDLIDLMQNEFDNLREINVDVEVLSPEQVNCTAYFGISCKQGYDFESVKENCENAVAEYINSLGIGENYYLAVAGNRILNVDGVENYIIGNFGSDMVMTQGQKAVVGTISITEKEG